jgi:hypothetical protein
MTTRGYVTVVEMYAALRVIYQEDPETNLQKALATAFADDLRPMDEKGRWKPSPLLILVGGAVLTLIVVFIYFSFGARG